jgi:hypothetical protein
MLLPGTPVVDQDGLLGFVLREQYKPHAPGTPPPPGSRSYIVITDAGHGPDKYTYGQDDLRVAGPHDFDNVDEVTLLAMLRLNAAELIWLGTQGA